MEQEKLICTGCKKEYPYDRIFPRCDDCSEPLELNIVHHNSLHKNSTIDKDVSVYNQNIIRKFAPFYSLSCIEDKLSLGEGFTPLVAADKLPPILDIDSLYLKNETVNPTWSFKDRGTFVSLQHAKSLGYKTIGTVSSGNMAASVAAYGARANLETFILLSADIPLEKIQPVLIYNPTLIKVKGDYGKLYYESLKIGREIGIYFLNSDIPFRIEGSKSISFEICEQLNYNVPDYVVIPTSSGGNARGIIKGFMEYHKQGIIDHLPGFICVQLEGCAPIYQAWKNGEEKISAISAPEAIDNAITNPYPPSGNELLRKLKMYNGIVTTVSDKEALEGQLLLAKEGIFAQPAAAVSILAIKSMRSRGIINKKDKCVAIITGSGLKYTGILNKHNFASETCTLKELKGKIASIIKK